MNQDDLVFACKSAKRFVESRSDEVAENKDDGFFEGSFEKMFDSSVKISAGRFWFKGDEFTNHAEDMTVAASGIELQFFLIRIEK